MKKSLLFAGICALALSASAQNPFAYDVKVDGIVEGQTTNSTIEVTYKLNAPAVAVDVQIIKADEPVLTKSLDGDFLTVGEHTASIDISTLSKDVLYQVNISVKGEVIDAPKKVGPTHTFWSPYGIAVDNNMQSKHYGRILVTESQPSVNTKATGYWTSNQLDGVGPGIYEFTPTMERVQNQDPTAVKYGYNGGLTFQAYSYASGSSMFGPKKVRITRDGRIFVGTLDALYNQPIYEVDPDNLNSWTPFFKGVVMNDEDDGTVVTEGDNKFVAGPSAAMDFYGEGENLRMVNLACKGGQVFAYGRFTTYEYPIGTATTWNAAAAIDDEVVPLSMQYTISSQAVSLAYDGDGDIWYAQYRGTPTEAQPAIKHVSKNIDGEWDEDYSDITSVVRGGGIAFSPDYKYLAFPTASNLLKIFTVDKSNGIALTEVYSINLTEIRGFNDIAWDNAYNLFSCDNGKEVFVQIQLPHPTGITNTAARKEFNFQVGDLTGVNDLNVKTVATRKYIENGQVVIERNGVKYNVAGQVIK